MEEEQCMTDEWTFRHWEWNETGYLQGSKEDRKFVQQILFHDYAEFSVVRDLSLGWQLRDGLLFHEKRENYDACQLFLDVLKRYQYEIEQFDS